ncbi:MAG TPA: tRNA lysidine(34) synthetase TilS [Phycisphaerae bacterium]|nr:tRNA lysidine(34) synthetase TilS [Phycisphaerae bacterium]
MDLRAFHNHLFAAAAELMPPGSGVVVAVSGGADSTALLHGLNAVNQQHNRQWRLHVAHLNHGLRADADADARFVVETARDLGLPSSINKVDAAAIARQRNLTVEEAGRRLRYEFFEEVASAVGAKTVALGHHADDQAETVLHRIARGTGIHGLAGMQTRRPIRAGSEIDVVRPLLGMRRADLRAYLSERHIAFCHDVTNDDAGAATRNQIRHRLMPILRELVNPEIESALIRLAEHAGRTSEAIRTFAEEALNRLQIRRQEQSITLSAEALAALPRAVQTEVIMLVLLRLGAPLQAIDFERIDATADILGKQSRHRRVELPGGVIAEHRGAEFCISRQSIAPPAEPE